MCSNINAQIVSLRTTWPQSAGDPATISLLRNANFPELLHDLEKPRGRQCQLQREPHILYILQTSEDENESYNTNFCRVTDVLYVYQKTFSRTREYRLKPNVHEL